MKKDEQIKKWLNGELSYEEMRDFQKTDDFKEIEKIDKYAAHFKAPDFDVSKEKSRLLGNKPNKKASQVISLPQIIKIAASLVIITGIVFYFLGTSEKINTISSADGSEFLLPDYSYFKLNTGSTLSYEAINWEDDRTVKLVGEAYFEVKRGSKFSIETPQGIVSVLGTKFNVKSREGFFEVICYEGKVQLSSNSLNRVLKKGDMAQIINNKISESTIEDIAPSWTKGKSSFKSVPLEMVLEEFERQYEVKIQAQNIPNEKLFSGTFANDNIDLALKSIAIPMNLSYEIREGLVILSGGSDQ